MAKSKWQIDPHKSARDNLWDAIDKSARSMVHAERLHVTPDEYHDLLMDIETAAYDAFVRLVLDHKYNRSYCFYDNVFGRVWSVAGHRVKAHLSAIRDKVQSRRDYSDHDEEDVVARVPLYLSQRESKRRRRRAKAESAASLLHKQQQDYDEYCDCCAEFGIAPMSFTAYSHQDD